MCNHILKEKLYWEGYTKDIKKFLANCEFCNGDKKTKKLKPPIKIILDEGPKYRYIIDLWTLPKKLANDTPYLYILDCVDHFSKYLNSFLLKN